MESGVGLAIIQSAHQGSEVQILPPPLMIDIKSLTDDELWLLTCGIEELHDSMRHEKQEFVEGVVDKASEIREILEIECNDRKLDYKRWQR